MARDTTLPLRQANVATLKADTALIALVDADQIYGESIPASKAWPFISHGVADVTPVRAQCMDGARIAFTVHAFSKSRYTDEIVAINAAIAAALDGLTIALDADFDADAHIHWAGSQTLPDPAERDAWHGLVRFEATVSS